MLVEIKDKSSIKTSYCNDLSLKHKISAILVIFPIALHLFYYFIKNKIIYLQKIIH